MEQARKEFFSNLTQDEQMDLTSHDFTISEIREIIEETPLHSLDKQIAIYRYIECMTLEEIANKLGYDVKTILSHVKKISIKLKKTCTRLFYKFV